MHQKSFQEAPKFIRKNADSKRLTSYPIVNAYNSYRPISQEPKRKKSKKSKSSTSRPPFDGKIACDGTNK